jgi:hypothetical protein
LPSRSFAPLLLVALDGLFAARRSGVRIHPELLERAPLAEKIPAAVEGDLHVGEAPAVCLRRPAARFEVPELVLLADELLDAVVDR